MTLTNFSTAISNNLLSDRSKADYEKSMIVIVQVLHMEVLFVNNYRSLISNRLTGFCHLFFSKTNKFETRFVYLMIIFKIYGES